MLSHQLAIGLTHQHHADLLREAHVGRQARELRLLRRLARAPRDREERGASSRGGSPALHQVAPIS